MSQIGVRERRPRMNHGPVSGPLDVALYACVFLLVAPNWTTRAVLALIAVASAMTLDSGYRDDTATWLLISSGGLLVLGFVLRPLVRYLDPGI